MDETEQSKFTNNDYYYLYVIEELGEPNFSAIAEALNLTKPGVTAISGTGNSQYVAKTIAKATGEILVNMTKTEMDKNEKYFLQPGERLGFVFPIYWWGMPTLAEEFIQKMQIELNDK